jgi:hypothetical protein
MSNNELPLSKKFSPNSEPKLWHGCLEWRQVDEMWKPWRLPADRMADYSPRPAPYLGLPATARMPAGIRASLRTDATSLALDLDVIRSMGSTLDILVDNELHKRATLVEGPITLKALLPPGEKTVEVWLPLYGEMDVGHLELFGASIAEPTPRNLPQWITYGGSIEQGSSASGPTESWPALVARTYGWDLVCLGFGGEGHLDPVVVRTIASIPVDLISLSLGGNILMQSSYSARTLEVHLENFIEGIRAAHEDVPIVVHSPNAHPAVEDTANAVGLTWNECRFMIERVVERLQRRGDLRVHFVDGLSVIGKDDQSLLPDNIHPNDEGHKQMASRLGPILNAALGRIAVSRESPIT